MAELRAVWPTPEGFGAQCECGQRIYVTVGVDVPPDAVDALRVPHQEFAFTCDSCQASHWVKVTPSDGSEPREARDG